ncbi:MAG TPA: phosphoenolpyruvate synthase [Candidatus Atribacteria bacterium]|nr:phosphoenolpyruvate synthase [Candidatus Atribacteria bacterium]
MIRIFKELKEKERILAGGKGGTLARLFQAGYPVPDGFIILHTAFTDDKLKLEAWSQVEAHLLRMRKKDKNITFAVRSSAMCEDSDLSSFAGEFETVLNVHTDKAVLEAIYRVRKSRKSERVQIYSREQNIESAHEISVVIQQMVHAEISGVLFTADPITGNRSSMTGNFVYGLGEKLVSGETNADTFTLMRPKGKYNGPVGLKSFARSLYKMADSLEKESGCPQDIEWSIVGGKLYLLQSRPITTLIGHNPFTGEWNDSLTGDYLWTNTNLMEAVPDVMTPSTWSLVQILHFDTATAVMPRALPYVGNICGRPYLNISLTLSIFRATGMKLPNALRRVEELFGHIPEGLDFSIPSIFTFSEILRQVPANIKLEIQFRKKIKKMSEFIVEAPGRCKYLQLKIKETQMKAGLVSLWNDELKSYLYHSFYMLRGAMKWFDNPAAVLRHDLIKLVGLSDANALLSNISDDKDLLASLGPVVGLTKVINNEMSREEYMEKYGHRGSHEWELSCSHPAEDPDWLDRQLEECVKSPVDTDVLLKKQRSESEAAWQRLRELHPKKIKSISQRIRKFAANAHMREAVRSEVTRVVGIIRAFALRAGELTGLNDGIFFLYLNEILNVLSGDNKTIKCISSRQMTYLRYSTLPPYPRIINGRFNPFQWAKNPNRRSDFYDSHASITITDSDTIKGFPGAAGQKEGIVRCLSSMKESDKLQPGEILVTVTTNIGWTILFPRVSAIITDVGAPLSHAAIVARELGIPAVVGCGNATMRLHTGDKVLVDGGQGVVKVLSSTKHDT